MSEEKTARVDGAETRVGDGREMVKAVPGGTVAHASGDQIPEVPIRCIGRIARGAIHPSRVAVAAGWSKALSGGPCETTTLQVPLEDEKWRPGCLARTSFDRSGATQDVKWTALVHSGAVLGPREGSTAGADHGWSPV